jgi:hypothetical protein
MAGEKQELTLDLLSRNKMGPATTAAARDIDKVGKAADNASKANVNLGKTTTVSGDAVEKLGSASERTAKHVGDLDAEIATVNQNLAFMHESFARASSQADRLDISKGIRKAENDLRRLTKSRNFLEGMLPDPGPMATTFMKRLGAGLAGAGNSIASTAGNHVGITIGASIAAAAAPVVVSGLQSAIAGGIGTVGIGAGIALAIKSDPALQVAGAGLGQRLFGALGREAVTAFRTPTLEAFNRAEASGMRMTKRIGQGFAAMHDDVLPLTDSLLRSAENITDAFADAMENSGPAVKGLGQSVELVTDGFADMIRILSDGSPEAAANLTLIAGATADVARSSAVTLNTVGKMSNDPWLTGPLLPLLRKHYRDAAEAQDELMDGANGSGFRDMSEGATELTESLKKTEEAIQDVLAANRALYGSEVDVAEAVADANEKIKENGRGLDLNTEKGRENRDALSQLADTLATNYDRYVAVNGAGDRAQGVMQRNRQAFIRAAEAAGYSAGKARELANRLLGIPQKRTPTIQLRGDESAKARLQALKNMLASIKNRTVYVRVAHIEGRKLKVEDQLGRSSYREYGGPVKKGHAYVVGEKRAEVFVPDRDGRVVPSIEKYRKTGGQASNAVHGVGSMSQYVMLAPGQRIPVTVDVMGSEGPMKTLIQYLFRNTNLGNA